MNMIYICSPLRGDIEGNLALCKAYCRCVCEITDGLEIPMAPHLYFTQFLEDDREDERNMGIEYGLEMLRRCKELWVIGERVSDGMLAEITQAMMWGIPIRWFRYDETVDSVLVERKVQTI